MTKMETPAQLIEYLKTLPQDERIISAVYTKDDSEYDIEVNEKWKIPTDKWDAICRRVNKDNYIWSAFYDTLQEIRHEILSEFQCDECDEYFDELTKIETGDLYCKNCLPEVSQNEVDK